MYGTVQLETGMCFFTKSTSKYTYKCQIILDDMIYTCFLCYNKSARTRLTCLEGESGFRMAITGFLLLLLRMRICIISYLWDKDLSRADLYKRGTIGTFELTVSVDDWFKGKAKVYVADFKPDEKPQ